MTCKKILVASFVLVLLAMIGPANSGAQNPAPENIALQQGQLAAGPMNAANAQFLSLEELLGKLIMFDESLSIRRNQSCASCHTPRVGWTGPISGINADGAVYPGSIRDRFGARKPPTAAYATTSPLFDYDPVEGLFFGGNFWDGRATGWDLGNPAADQARGPFLNPVEQALPNKAVVVRRVCSSPYSLLFRWVWGQDACRDVETAYNNIALSLAAFEGSAAVNQFSSKYDAYLAGKASLTEQELAGLELFNDPLKGNCAACHISEAGPNGEPPLFTDYTYDNLGVPKNLMNPVYQTDPGFIDPGLAGFLTQLADENNQGWRSSPFVTQNVAEFTNQQLMDLVPANYGKHKVPTLRNVDLRPGPGFIKAYMHNGVFKSLEEVVSFYNTRDVPGADWPPPEVADNVNMDELGDLGLTPAEEAAIVAFMKTLSDGYMKP